MTWIRIQGRRPAYAFVKNREIFETGYTGTVKTQMRGGLLHVLGIIAHHT